eukprot:TRINITY_DN1338_c0_g1_i2.p1 TRINITY_DN1338_c0_g1~~TRINITY_DN1338_c0_g1_i2.p1  ORF type:complete len:277 (-),score=23.25 TRINITY_DN1338_c0_g1_i2:100-930(-)
MTYHQTLVINFQELHFAEACIKGRIDTADMILESGLVRSVDCPTTTAGYQSALITLATSATPPNNALEVAAWLLSKGANPNYIGNAGESILIQGCMFYKPSIPILKLMVEHGADPFYRKYDGETALHLAAGSGHVEMVELFLLKGVPVNVQSTALETPLHKASSFGQAAAVTLLLEAGADPHMRNQAGKTPVDVAKNKDIKKIFETFKAPTRSYPARPDLLDNYLKRKQELQAAKSKQSLPTLSTARSAIQQLGIADLEALEADITVRMKDLRADR